MTMTTRVAALPLLMTALLAACSDDGASGPTDTGADTGADTGTDTAVDVDPDAGTDSAADGSGGTDAAADASIDATDDAGPSCNTDGATDDLIVAGDYFLAVSLTPFGGLLVNFRAVVVADADEILRLDLYSVSPDLTWQSEEAIATACAVPVVDGGFEFAFDVVTIPSQGTTTGVEVDVEDFTLSGTVLDTTTFCGVTEGYVPLLSVSLDSSTFRAVPWGEQSTPPLAACEVTEAQTWDPIAECPVLVPGDNTLFSADLDRTFKLYAPTDAMGALPLVFLFHGLGGSAQDMVDGTGFADLVDANGFVLLVPDGANQADGSQVFPVDWNILASQYDNDNQDLVFFDDLLKCVSEQYDIDADRVYVTGMSGGGLMTTFLGLHRADVVAAAAPMSGGYLQAWQSLIAPGAPWMVTWGGTEDFAVDVDFNDAALDLMGNLEADSAFIVQCDHGGGHVWPSEMTAAAWAFLSSYTRASADNPLATGDLPAAFPAYCTRRD